MRQDLTRDLNVVELLIKHHAVKRDEAIDAGDKETLAAHRQALIELERESDELRKMLRIQKKIERDMRLERG